jgi:hypothetical protein
MQLLEQNLWPAQSQCGKYRKNSMDRRNSMPNTVISQMLNVIGCESAPQYLHIHVVFDKLDMYLFAHHHIMLSNV